MQKIFFIALFSGSLLYATGGPVKPEVSTDNRPNVIIVLSDDQGYGDFSCLGNPVLQTPALDRLYNESIRLSNFHVTPLCTPTRGELLSGLEALHNRASNVLTGRGLMRRDIITMPEVFQNNGYQTGIFGKWHLGDNYPDRPMDRGFDKCIWFKGWGLLSEIEFDNDYYNTRYLDSLDTRYSDKYCTDLWFDEAMKWMDEKCERHQPFFTYLPLNAVHGPFHAPESEKKKYVGKVKDDITASYLGMVSNIDQNMARLDQWLTEKGIKNNTLVIFMNDNGGTGGVEVYNAGMRGKKGSNYDGGHRAACFIRWPEGNFGKPRTIAYASMIPDLLPTFIDLFKFRPDPRQHFDGRSLAPVFRNTEKPLKDRMFVVQYTSGNRPEKDSACVVWNAWRLVGGNELYDIGKDSGQENNVAAKYPAIVKKMKGFYDKWWTGVEDETDEFLPAVVGSDKENPVILNSNGWAGMRGVNTQWAVAQAAGPAKGGEWHILAEKGGKYKVEISRWPFHLHREMTIAGPSRAVGGTKLREGRAVPVAGGSISLDRARPLVAHAGPGATELTTAMNINAGEHILRAWFTDKDGNDLCGAYYIRLERLP